MRGWHMVLLISLCLLLLPGCFDQVNVEDVNMTLMIGLDLDEKGRLILIASNPVYSKEAKKKVEKFIVQADSIRESRGEMDARAVGVVMGGKFQVVLLSKRLVEQGGWFPLLDLVYREAKQSVTPRLVVVDNPLQEIYTYNPEDKPRLALLLRKLVDSSYDRNITVKTTMQELHRQLFEKCMTPSVTEIRKQKEKALAVTGTALFTHQGDYAMSIGLQESGLLNMLRQDQHGDLSFTIPMPAPKDTHGVAKPKLSFAVHAVKYKMDCGYQQGRFRFDLMLKLPIAVTERMFRSDVTQATPDPSRLERQIGQEMQHEIETLI
ncbi:MAG: Ger(x)C family spore germination protein, partial [Tumebacillaceae bacterium]